MLNENGFDLWADGYDRTVGLSDEDGSYPFAGYREVLGRIYSRVMAMGRPKVLDIGFGTGTLTARLYGQGCEIWGQDFSGRMLELAGKKMPGAHLFQGDFSRGLAAPLLGQHYDAVVATYSLHHLTDGQKVEMIRLLKTLSPQKGSLLMGDVAFSTAEELENCRKAVGKGWDEDEIYFVYDRLKPFFPALEFEPVSFCAGVFCL